MMKLHGILNSDAMKTLIWQIEIIIPSLTPPAWRCVHTDFPSPFPFEAPSTCLQDKISTMSPGNLPKCMLQVLRGGGGIILILEQKWLQNLILLKRRQNIMQNKYQYLPPFEIQYLLKTRNPPGPLPWIHYWMTLFTFNLPTPQKMWQFYSNITLRNVIHVHSTAWKIFPVSSQEQQWNFLYTKLTSFKECRIKRNFSEHHHKHTGYQFQSLFRQW